MGFLRRLFRGGGSAGDESAADPDGSSEPASIDPDAEERQHELDLLRSEAERLDELTQRQLRYAQYSWKPPSMVTPKAS